MKVGNVVRLAGDQPGIQQVWVIKSIKSDARGLWLQFDETPDDMWYASTPYEVISESR
jgi:hypothetical protein